MVTFFEIYPRNMPFSNPPAIIRCFSHSTLINTSMAPQGFPAMRNAWSTWMFLWISSKHLRSVTKRIKESWPSWSDFLNFEALAGWSSKYFCLAYLHPGGWQPSSKLVRIRRNLSVWRTCFRRCFFVRTSRLRLQRGKTSQQHAANSKAPQLIKPSGYPLVNSHIAMENHHAFNGKIREINHHFQ